MYVGPIPAVFFVLETSTSAFWTVKGFPNTEFCCLETNQELSIFMDSINNVILRHTFEILLILSFSGLFSLPLSVVVYYNRQQDYRPSTYGLLNSIKISERFELCWDSLPGSFSCTSIDQRSKPHSSCLKTEVQNSFQHRFQLQVVRRHPWSQTMC